MSSDVGGHIYRRFRIVERHNKYRVQRWMPVSEGIWMTEHKKDKMKVVPVEFDNLSDAETYCEGQFGIPMEDSWKVVMTYEDDGDGQLIRNWY